MKLLIEKILSIGDGEHHYAFDVPARDIGMDMKDFEGRELFEGNVRTEVTLTKSGHVYAIRFSASTVPRLLCDRCLAEVHRPIEGSFMVVYSDRKDRHGDEDQEIRFVDTHRTNEISVDKDVADTLMLALPVKVLCREDCRGLCAQCGADLNTTRCEHCEPVSEDVV